MSSSRPFLLGFLSFLCFSLPAHSQVTIFGEDGTFGALGDVTPSGQPLAKVAIPNWEIDPGLTYFFPAVTSDGTIFIANMVQTDNQYLRSSCSTVITCFNPDQPLCYDSETGTSGYFSNIRIPTSEGQFWSPDGSEAYCHTLAPFEAFGADVSDVQTIVDPVLGERVFFNSATGSRTSGPMSFPALGSIHKTANGWELDLNSLRQPIDLYAQNQVVCDAPLDFTDLCLTDADCGGTTCDHSELVFGYGKCVIFCASDLDCTMGHVCEDSKCRSPTCAAMNETAVLPRSNRIVATHYSGRLSVMDASGNVLAGYKVEPDADPCNTGTTMTAAPRSVAADPAGEIGDERFMVDFDSSNAQMGHVAQEYSYDEIQRTITPVSARFYPDTPSYFHSPSCSDDFTNGIQSAYDQDGNLWVGTERGLAAGRMHIYFKDQETGKRKVETECSWIDSDTGDPRPSGFLCQSDLDVGRAFLTLWNDLEWGFKWSGNSVVDDVSGVVIVSTKEGQPSRITVTSMFRMSPSLSVFGLGMPWQTTWLIEMQTDFGKPR